jgi:hypothetical protein
MYDVILYRLGRACTLASYSTESEAKKFAEQQKATGHWKDIKIQAR